jgi:hypothetical protein
MRDELPLTRRRAIARFVFAGLVVLTCAALFSAAALVPAPPGVLPIVVIVCIGAPMLASLELPAAYKVLREETTAIAALRRHLAQLPETRHPFDG